MITSILFGIISATYTVQTIYDLSEKIGIRHTKAINDLIVDSVEHAYVTYIYDIKQKCKHDGIPIVYDTHVAHEIASVYFYDNYSKPLFSRTNTLKVNKKIKDQLRFFRAKIQDNPITSSA